MKMYPQLLKGQKPVQSCYLKENTLRDTTVTIVTVEKMLLILP
jgi:hypothetical protein